MGPGGTRAERETALLLDMIRQAGVPVPPGAGFRQTYASRSQRTEGGSVWVLIDADGRETRPLVCSIWPRRLLLRAGRVEAWRDSLGEWHIDPERGPTV
jgi:hypothetical protein